MVDNQRDQKEANGLKRMLINKETKRRLISKDSKIVDNQRD